MRRAPQQHCCHHGHDHDGNHGDDDLDHDHDRNHGDGDGDLEHDHGDAAYAGNQMKVVNAGAIPQSDTSTTATLMSW